MSCSRQGESMSVSLADNGFYYAGLDGPYSCIPLQRLLEAGLTPAAVLLPRAAAPGKQADLPVRPADTTYQLLSVAKAHGLPIVYCPDAASMWPVFDNVDIGTVLVAGWPWRIPSGLLQKVDYAWLNLHPSLLPAYRGPAPLFWQLRDGARLGVSLHRMDAVMDEGPLLMQAPCDVPPGTTMLDSEISLAGAGAELFIRALRMPPASLQFSPQSQVGVSRQGWPQADDYILSANSDAVTAYNFFVAMLSAGRPCYIDMGKRLLQIYRIVGRRGHVLHVLSDQGELDIVMGEN